MIRRGGSLLALLAALAVAPQASARVFEYLYVEANAGSSAGGHFALRLGDWVYDYQNAELGTLRMRRSDSERFRYLYTVLENRTLHIAGIELPPETREAIAERFNRRYLIQEKQFSVLDSLRGDRELLGLLIECAERSATRERGESGSAEVERANPPERIAARRSGGQPATPSGRTAARSAEGESSALRVRGAGFFYGDGSEADSEESPALRALRERSASGRGPGYLGDRIAALERTARALSPAPDSGVQAALRRDVAPDSGYHFSDRYRDLAAKLVALRVLDAAPSIAPSARRVPSGDEFALRPEEARQIRTFAQRLEARLAVLVDSKRPDWGYPLLLGMARLETLRESLERGRWVVLDAVPESPDLLSRRAVRRRDPFVVELGERARVAFAEARSQFANAAEPGEPTLAWLEEALNRHAVFRRGFESNAAIPVYEGGSLPDRAAIARGVPIPEVDLPALRHAAAVAEARERAYVEALQRAFDYRLVSNNCVTEIFAALGAGWKPPAARDRPAGHERLAAGVAGGPLDFVPLVAYRKVLEAHPDAERSEIPSLRRTRLEAMYAAENDLLVYLRESITLSSTVYRRNDAEPFFVFFTDDAPPLRPLYGALNLAAGIGEMALGVFRAPWDRGRSFTSGLRGAAFSVPELFFLNLRKGILEYAPGDTPRTLRRPVQSAASEPQIRSP